MHYYSMLFFAILITTTIVGLNAQTTLPDFSRNCVNHNDCDFSHSGMTPVFLKCSAGKCQCKNSPYQVMDIAWYTVRIVNNECVVKYNAPCGLSNGLKLVCDTGKSCIQNRCRSGEHIQPLNHSCDEDIDCQIGLQCKTQAGSFPISKYCQQWASFNGVLILFRSVLRLLGQ